jgi:hypothetical protein
MTASVIGQAIIEVVSSGNSFDKSLQAETGKGLSAAEKAAGDSGTKIGTNLKGKFSSAFSGISTTAKVALGAGLLEVFHTGLDEVKDYQGGLAQLQQGLKTTGNVAGLTAPQMEDLASSIQDYSGQTDDSIVKTEQLLLTFTNIRNEAGKGNDIFTQTTKISADMAARMGGDASASAIQLGKALNDPIKGVAALSRVGVTFDEGQKKQIKTLVEAGKTADAQKIILRELNKEFGGSAKAVGDTLPGQIEKGKRKFEDLSQSIVTAFLPVFNAVIGIFTTLMPILTALAPILAPLSIAIIGIAAATKVWGLAQQFFNFIMAEGSLTTGGWITIIVLLVTVLVEAYQHSKTFRDIVQSAFHIVAAAAHALSAAVSAMGDFFREVIGAIVGFVKSHWMLLVAILTGPIGLAVAFIITHWHEVSDTVKKVVGDVIGFFRNLVNFVTSLPGKIGSAASGMWDGIKDAFKGMVNGIIGIWNHLHFTVGGWTIPVPFAPDIHVPRLTVGFPPLPYLATGGILDGAGIAGEFGPELVLGKGRVFSRSETSRMMGNNITIHPGAFQVVIQGNANKSDVEDALQTWEDGLITDLRRRGVLNR